MSIDYKVGKLKLWYNYIMQSYTAMKMNKTQPILIWINF